jgi:hypothetical protein
LTHRGGKHGINPAPGEIVSDVDDRLRRNPRDARLLFVIASVHRESEMLKMMRVCAVALLLLFAARVTIVRGERADAAVIVTMTNDAAANQI